MDDVAEDHSEADLRQHLANLHLLAVDGVLDLEHVLCVQQHDGVGVVIEGMDQQQPKLLVECRVPLFAFGESSVNALLAGGQLPAFCDEDFVHSGQGPAWHAKHPCMIMLAWHTMDFARRGSAESQHHLSG